MVCKNSKKLAIFKKNDHELWSFFSFASICGTLWRNTFAGRISFAGRMIFAGRMQCTRANNYSPLLERILAQAVAADGEARHVGRSLLAEILVNVDFCEILT